MRIQSLLALGCLSVSFCVGAYAQSAAVPEFEAADIRLNKSGDDQSADFLAGVQVNLRSMTMKTLIGLAWKETRLLPELTSLSIAVAPSVAEFKTNLKDYLKGGPAWLDSDRWDVIAKAPAGTSDDNIRLMLQKLLIDRFHLAVHKEERSVKVWEMVVAKGGPKLKQSDGGVSVCTPSIGPDNVYHRDCHNMTMAHLSEQLAGFAPRFFEGRPIVDATGLQGGWDFRLDWTPLSGGLAGLQSAPGQGGGTPGPPPPPPPPGSQAAPSGQGFDTGTTIFRTMEKKLGLKLEQKEHPMPIVVIDKIDRTPTDN